MTNLKTYGFVNYYLKKKKCFRTILDIKYNSNVTLDFHQGWYFKSLVPTNKN